MHMDGRQEKRAVTILPAILVAASDPDVTETVTTVNLSSRGARVISKHQWRTGDFLSVVTAAGGFQRSARVVYIEPLRDSRFCVGLEFSNGASNSQDRPFSWSERPKRRANTKGLRLSEQTP